MSNESQQLHTKRIESIVAWNKLWSDHNSKNLVELFVDDLVYEDVPTNRVSHGKQELRAFAEEVFGSSSDVHYEITRVIVDGDRGSAEVVIRGTHTGSIEGLPPTGRRIEVRGHSAFEFVGDKIKRCSDYWCLATMLRQLGFLPSV